MKHQMGAKLAFPLRILSLLITCIMSEGYWLLSPGTEFFFTGDLSQTYALFSKTFKVLPQG